MSTDHQPGKTAGFQRATTLLTIPETCNQLQLSRGMVDKLIAAGLLKAVKIGRSKRVRATDLDTFVEGLSNATD